MTQTHLGSLGRSISNARSSCLHCFLLIPQWVFLILMGNKGHHLILPTGLGWRSGDHGHLQDSKSKTGSRRAALGDSAQGSGPEPGSSLCLCLEPSPLGRLPTPRNLSRQVTVL